MSWFAQQTGGDTAAAREQGRYLRAAGVARALDGLCGPFGVRRFVVRFRHRAGSVRVESIEAVPLQTGGGPPPADPRGTHLAALERALTALHRNMATGPRWDRGAIAVLRDAQGRTELIPAFEDDAEVVVLDDLRVPAGGGHPLESRDHQLDMERHAHDLGRVHQQTHATVMDWDWWEVDDSGQLVVHWDGPPARMRSHPCTVLGTFEPRWSRWTWQTPTPLFPGPVWAAGHFPATLEAAMELGLLATARLRGQWLFVGSFGDDGAQLLVAVMR